MWIFIERLENSARLNGLPFHVEEELTIRERCAQTLRDALLAHRADKRYEHAGFKEVYLLAHYDFKSFAYNTPFDEPEIGFKEVAEFASKVLAGRTGFFDRIFLVNCLDSQEEAHRIA